MAVSMGRRKRCFNPFIVL